MLPPPPRAWRFILKRVHMHWFGFVAALWLTSCSQGEGEPCQVTSDCESGLLCCPSEDTPRAVCIAADSCPDDETDGDERAPNEGDAAAEAQ